jgi:hypothetical protein
MSGRSHSPIIPGTPSERTLRSMLNSVAREMSRSKGKKFMVLMAEEKRLEKLLQDVTERKCQMIESQLAEIEAAKTRQN